VKLLEELIALVKKELFRSLAWVMIALLAAVGAYFILF
jgi:hypothetical protein